MNIQWDEDKIKDGTLGEKEDNIKLLNSFGPVEVEGWIKFFIPYIKVPKTAKQKREVIRSFTKEDITNYALFILSGWKVPDPKDESSETP